MDFEARYVLINTSTPETLEQRLKASGKEDSAVQEILKKSPAELEPAKVDELFNRTVVDDDEVAAVKDLGDYIYGKSQDKSLGEQDSGDDAAMKDDEATGDVEDVEAKEEATMTDA
jgi:guanylate kinase